MKRALVIGIDNYQSRLYGCINDAIEFAKMIRINENGDPNFDVRLELNVPNRATLRRLVQELFSESSEIALFYFSGHGYADHTGGYLVTPDHEMNDVGVSMDEIITLANNSSDRNKMIILDCCHAGAMGNPAAIGMKYTQIREGVTILTSCKEGQVAIEKKGHGVFTSLLLNALDGGAANINGEITPGSIYAYIDQALGAWEQRPVFKTNISYFTVLRSVNPQVPRQVLRNLKKYFSSPSSEYLLNPSHEPTNSHAVEHKVIEPLAEPAKVAVFKELQMLESVGLVMPVNTPHMYFAAMESRSCKLTPLGCHYWQLAQREKI